MENKINKLFSFSLGEKNYGVVYFIGIGGIGMSALAKFFVSKGIRVSGYDKTATKITGDLEAMGVPVHYEENIDKVPEKTDLVIYTPAIPSTHPELGYCRKRGDKVVKRSDVLEIITKSSFNICVAGTHGKTTITSMVAHLIRDSGMGCNAFLGGIAVNYGTNFWGSEKNICVVEADEYDRSFLKLDPDIAIISAMDADHLDIYGTASAMEEAFIDFSRKVRPGGKLIRQFRLKRGKDLVANEQITYSLQNENADVYAKDIKTDDGSYEFDVIIRGDRIENLRLNMGGMHNVENVVAAIAAVSSLEINKASIRKAVATFRGVKRRFEYIIKNNRLVFIDDYAHHPEELRALINGAKSLFRQKKCTIIFQPHLYSRTRDLADGFAESLDQADEIILLPIYPARELPVEGVDSRMILDKMKNDNKRILKKEELLAWLQNMFKKNRNREFGEVIITAGAGDIDVLVDPIKNLLNEV